MSPTLDEVRTYLRQMWLLLPIADGDAVLGIDELDFQAWLIANWDRRYPPGAGAVDLIWVYLDEKAAKSCEDQLVDVVGYPP